MSQPTSKIDWALTARAQRELDDLTATGLDPELALALIDLGIERGLYKEEEIYQIPADLSRY